MSISVASSPLTPHGPGFRFVDHFALVPAPSESPRGTATFHLLPTLSVFADHFPGNPIMPAALLLEHAAQASGILWMSLAQNSDTPSNSPLFVAGVDTLRILGPALPGDTLHTEVELLKEFGSLAQFQFETRSAEKTITKGRLTLSRQLKA